MSSLTNIRRSFAVAAVVASILSATPTHGQTNSLSDPKEVEHFFDGLMAAQLASTHAPGATVSVVKDGKLLFAKGYGYADLDKRTPVTADKTLFRVASVSKLFTWTAVMQLVEQNKLDLNADVNTYLDFKIPDTYPTPISLAHLMSHSPGFEELGIGVFVRTLEEVAPLREYLVNNMPKRVRPPGEVSAYSNYGAALAGYIVARVSEMPFDEYVATNILKPLGMTHSTFQQPLPSELASDMSTGYLFNGVHNDARGFEFLPPVPAGALSATATDMATFMIAHLQNGKFGDARILQDETAQLMHRQHFTNDPRVSGFAHGFGESTINNLRVIWHSGDTLYFHSALVLQLEHNVGIFVAFNSDKGGQGVGSTVQAFMNRYYPTLPLRQTTLLAGFAERTQRINGSYHSTRRNYTTPEKIASLFNMASVQAAKDGALTVTFGALGGQTLRYVEVEPYVFMPADNSGDIESRLLFRVDESNGSVTAFMDNNPTMALEKQSWYATSNFHLSLAGLCLLMFLSILIVSPVAGWVNRKLHIKNPTLAQIGMWVALIVSLLGLVFVIAFMSAVMDPEVVYGLPAYFSVMRFAPWLMIVLVIGMVVCTVLSWSRKYWGAVRRVHYSLSTIASVAFMWWVWYWRLLW